MGGLFIIKNSDALRGLALPHALPHCTNKETVSDMMEAFLGLAYLWQFCVCASHAGCCEAQREVVELLDHVTFTVYFHRLSADRLLTESDC